MQRAGAEKWIQSAEGFQSLSGFQVRCNSEHCPQHAGAMIVSIPIGFSSSLQRKRLGALDEFRMFQSLSGFQVRCNCSIVDTTKHSGSCFNPYRVFKFVATRQRLWPGWCRTCFNPYRVFKFVATLDVLDNTLFRDEFQSLSGFQVRCNRSRSFWERETHVQVSIPIGFSSSLQLRDEVDQFIAGM